ncbi:hypothetical protein DAPPUDRAFT_340689, partial [Daphnia pulex]
MCQYCHTRTEQQFHPEIYKSTKCHDMQTNSYCPRGSFCAFAHGDFEVVRDNGQYQDGGNNLAELLSSALPAVNNRTYGKENTNLNDLNDGRSIDLLLDNSPRSILDTHSTSSSATASTSVPMQTAYSRLQSLETGESILASSGPTAVGTTIGGFGPLVHPICKPRSLSVPGADMNSSGIDRMISLDRDEWDPITNPDQFDTLSKKSNLYGTGTLGGLLSHLQPAAYFPTAARLSNSTNAPDCVIGHAMDENEEQFKDSSREYESEQPSLCESITMGVGLLTGSAPVNIPRSGLDRHPPRLSPSPPAVNLFSGIRVGAHEIPLEGSNNSTSLFFKR